MQKSDAATARRVAREAMRHGALAVVAMGSVVRGDAHLHSDIDLVVVLLRAPSPTDLAGWLRPYRMRGGRLISAAWTTPAMTRAAFRDPHLAPTHVPGMREAVMLADPDGVAARLQRAAVRWRWDDIASECDAWVADRVTGLAEEAHKLAGLYTSGAVVGAAVQRSLLALHLAVAIAVHKRMLYGSENTLWDGVGAAMGARWRREQRRALSMEGESLLVSCRAALGLYRLTAAEVRGVLDVEQRAVVDAVAALRLR